MSRSFITYDSADGMGIRAQVLVKTGTLPISGVDSPHNGVAKVHFDHKAKNLKFPVNAHVLEDSDTYRAAVEAAGTERDVTYRIETRRKDQVDRTKAFPPKSEAERKDDVTYLVTSGTDGNDVVATLVAIDTAVSSEAVTDANEDSKWEKVPRVQVQPYLTVDPDAVAAPAVVTAEPTPDTPDAALHALNRALDAHADEGVLSALRAAALLTGATAAEVFSTPENSNPADVNLGSDIVMLVLDLHQWVHTHIIADPAKTGDTSPEDLHTGATWVVHHWLLPIVDTVQMLSFGGGTVDRTAASYRNAAAATQLVITQLHAIPADVDDFPQWSANVATAAHRTLVTAAVSADTEAPLLPLAADNARLAHAAAAAADYAATVLDTAHHTQPTSTEQPAEKATETPTEPTTEPTTEPAANVAPAAGPAKKAAETVSQQPAEPTADVTSTADEPDAAELDLLTSATDEPSAAENVTVQVAAQRTSEPDLTSASPEQPFSEFPVAFHQPLAKMTAVIAGHDPHDMFHTLMTTFLQQRQEGGQSVDDLADTLVKIADWAELPAVTPENFLATMSQRTGIPLPAATA